MLIGWQEAHPTCKKLSDKVLVCGYLSEAQCKCFAYGPADAIAPPPTPLASVKSRIVLPFWYRLTQVVLEKVVKWE